MSGTEHRSLADGLDGRALLPGDAEYDEVRRAFNGMFDRRPAVIAMCETNADVQRSIAYARAHGLPIAVRGGGHSIAGFSVCDDGLVIDLRRLNDIRVDPPRRVASAGGGVTWEEFDPACLAHGLATTGGTFGDTGIAGLTLGGGIGHLQGKFGLTCDNLIGATVVTADGDVIETSDDEHPDLFWALRGGGGNFGVVTRFAYRLHDIGSLLAGGLIFEPGRAAEVMRVFRATLEEAPDELTVQMVLRTNGQTAVFPCWNGPIEEGQAWMDRFRKIGCSADTVQPVTYDGVQALFPKIPFGIRHYWTGQFVQHLADDLINAIGDLVASPSERTSSILIEGLSGAPRRVSPNATAFAHRDAQCNVSALAIWMDAADDEAEIAWARSVSKLVAPFSRTGGGYVNYMQDEPADRIRRAYGNENFARLQQAKSRYDPENVFRLNQNIPPLPRDR